MLHPLYYGQGDRCIREKPNARLLALEAHILFTNNKIASWPNGKSADEKELLFAMACRVAPQHQKAFRQMALKRRQHAEDLGREEEVHQGDD